MRLLLILLLLATPALAITPDEVSQAQDLIRQEATLKNQIEKLKMPDAMIQIIIYLPPDKKRCSMFNAETTSFNKTPYCSSDWTPLIKPSPSIIADLQNQVDEIESKLCKLGVRK